MQIKIHHQIQQQHPYLIQAWTEVAQSMLEGIDYVEIIRQRNARDIYKKRIERTGYPIEQWENREKRSLGHPVFNQLA